MEERDYNRCQFFSNFESKKVSDRYVCTEATALLSRAIASTETCTDNYMKLVIWISSEATDIRDISTIWTKREDTFMSDGVCVQDSS